MTEKDIFIKIGNVGTGDSSHQTLQKYVMLQKHIYQVEQI